MLDRQASVPRIPRSVRAVALADGRAESWLETWGRLTSTAEGLPPFLPQVELRIDGQLVEVVEGWYPDAAVAVEFDGRVTYRRPQYGRTPDDELWREQRNEDLLRSLGVRFIRVAAEDLTSSRRGALEGLVRRQLATEGPRLREFTAIPRAEGHWRGPDTGDDGWLARTGDDVGVHRPAWATPPDVWPRRGAARRRAGRLEPGTR